MCIFLVKLFHQKVHAAGGAKPFLSASAAHLLPVGAYDQIRLLGIFSGLFADDPADLINQVIPQGGIHTSFGIDRALQQGIQLYGLVALQIGDDNHFLIRGFQTGQIFIQLLQTRLLKPDFLTGQVYHHHFDAVAFLYRE